MSKLRVHELARELGRQNREVIEFLKSKGVDVRSHMSMVDEPAVSEVKNRFRKAIITGKGAYCEIGDSQDRRKGCNSKIRRR